MCIQLRDDGEGELWGGSSPPAFHLRELGIKSALFEIQYNNFQTFIGYIEGEIS